MLASSSGLSSHLGTQCAVPMHISQQLLSQQVLYCPEQTPRKRSGTQRLQLMSSEGYMDKLQPTVKVLWNSRRLFLGTPRQVWGVQCSKPATMHMRKMAECDYNCMQCSIVAAVEVRLAVGTGDTALVQDTLIKI